MAKAARRYLAIPASEVAVERLFSAGRDLLGIRRHSMTGEAMRFLMLLGAEYKNHQIVITEEILDEIKSRESIVESRV
jgi:hypothetical protein